MHGPDGTDYPNEIKFIEFVPPARLVYDHGAGPGFHVIATCDDLGGRTKLTMRGSFGAATERDTVVREFGAIEGAKQTLERLAEYLPTMSTSQ